MASERKLTARLAKFFPSHRDVMIGIGDDAAVVRQRHDRSVLCCDPVVAGVHFEPNEKPEWVGQKAVNRNLSDLAAMGATADWLLVSLVVPRSLPELRLLSLLRGIRSAARRAGATVVGGDVATSDGPMVVTVSAFGHLEGPALKRSGARVGDTLHCTGPLGGSRAGHHLRFRPALAEGTWLAQQKGVHAAMDVSDGLLLDLQTMLDASSQSSRQLGAELDARRIPIRQAARDLAAGDFDRGLQHALCDGEDHVLLWSQHSSAVLARGGPLSARARQAIGRVITKPGLWLRDGDVQRPLTVRGFQHHLQD